MPLCRSTFHPFPILHCSFQFHSLTTQGISYGEGERKTSQDTRLVELPHSNSASTVDAHSVPPSLSQSDINSVETFLIFIGWAKSCHSILGSMLDAHPNVILAHEYNLFPKIGRPSLNRKRLYQELYKNSYTSVRSNGWRDSGKYSKGYSLEIDGSWQGRFTELKVIGDKSGGRAVKEYNRDSKKFKKLYQQLASSVKVPIKVLQVVRNPLDMIATKVLYMGSSSKYTKVNATIEHKYRNFELINKVAIDFLNFTKAIMRMIPDVGLSPPLEVHCEDLISHPSKTISDICQFLDLECSPDYLQMCVDKTFKNVSESRHLVDWDPNTLPSLIEQLRTFPFFQKYKLSI